MTKFIRYIVMAVLIVGLVPIWTVAATGATTTDSVELVVIVNPENELGNVSSKELKKIFTGDTMYFGKRKISSYLTSDVKTSEAVLKKVYRLRNKRMLKKMWMKKLYRGIVFVQPAILSTRSEVIDSVSKDPGAIAIVMRDKLPKGVKVVKVDNKPFF